VARAASFVLLLALLVAGCGGDEPAWEGPQRPFGADGTVRVDAFTDYVNEVDELWERSPALLAGEFLRLDRAQATRVAIAAEATGEGTETATVTVTLSGLLDDSIAAERYVLAVRREGDVWRLTSAMWAQRCAPGRGHDEFSPETCV
jgi:hypothetical protein